MKINLELLNVFLNSANQGTGRVHLRRHGARILGRAGRGVQAVDGGLVVRHDGVRGSLPEELEALPTLQQENYGLFRKRYIDTHAKDRGKPIIYGHGTFNWINF